MKMNFFNIDNTSLILLNTQDFRNSKCPIYRVLVLINNDMLQLNITTDHVFVRGLAAPEHRLPSSSKFVPKRKRNCNACIISLLLRTF